MILKQEGNTIALVVRQKNLFVLETRLGLEHKIMLMQERDRPMYLLSSNPQV